MLGRRDLAGAVGAGKPGVESRLALWPVHTGSMDLAAAIGRRSSVRAHSAGEWNEAKRRDVMMSGETCGYGCRSAVFPKEDLASLNVRGRARING